jgi:hypothetical protein
MMVAELKRVEADKAAVFLRGIKLVVMFLVLNLVGTVALHGKGNLAIWGILFTGSPTHTSFEILLPMGYLLCTSFLLEKLPFNKFITFFLFVALLFLPLSQKYNYNLLFYLVGAAGYLFGRSVRIEKALARVKPGVLSALAAIIVIAMLGGILKSYPSNWAILLVRGAAILQLFYWLANLKQLVVIKNMLERLGRNSFFVYILQIAILKLVVLFFTIPRGSMIVTLFVLTIIYMVIFSITSIVDHYRKISPFVKNIYAKLF